MEKSIQSFEDLANQDVIDYGTVEFGSTMMFFKVLLDFIESSFGLSLRQDSRRIPSFSFPAFQRPGSPENLPAHGAQKELCVLHGRGHPADPGGELCLYR